MHAHSADVTEPTCVEVLQPGYRIGDRVVRPARVAVAEPEPSAPTAAEPTDDRTMPTRARRREEGRRMSTQGLPREGLLQGPRRPQGRQPRRDQEGLPQARPRVPPGRQQGRRRRPRSGSRRSPRPTTCCPTPSGARSTTRRAPLFGAGGVRFRGPAVPARPGGGDRSTSATCSAAAAAAPAAARRHASAACSAGGRGARRRRGPRRGADVETEVTLRFTEAVDGRHRPAADDQRAAVPDLPRHRRPRPARCRSRARPAMGTGQTSRNQGGFALRRAVPRLPRPRPGRRRPVPRLPRQRPGDGHPHDAGAHPGRASATASGSG